VNLITTSDGLIVDSHHFERRAFASIAKAQLDQQRRGKDSNRRRRVVERLAQQHRRVRNRRRDLAHKLSRQLVNDYDLIVLEDLAITSMVRRPRPRRSRDGAFEPNGASSKSGLNRSIHDAGWGELARMIAYKAEDAGRDVLAVCPRFTSQRCACCGHTDAANRRTQAEFQCVACGHRAHADVNAACNVLWAGRALRASARVR
jgi:putative transposase